MWTHNTAFTKRALIMSPNIEKMEVSLNTVIEPVLYIGLNVKFDAAAFGSGSAFKIFTFMIL